MASGVGKLEGSRSFAMNAPVSDQRIRAELVRILAPNDERYPHDLLLYPADAPEQEHWNIVWVKRDLYEQFLNEWDGKTCPACRTPTIKKSYRSKYTGDMSNAPYSSTAYYDLFNVFTCTQCHCGWTERTGSESFTDVSYG